MDHHRERIEGQGHFNEADPLGGTGLEFLGVDGPRSIADLHPAAAEIPETRGAARFLETDADVVYGTRFKGGNYVRLHFFWHYLANKILTTLTNVVTNLNMSDMETGYKLFKSEVIKKINLKENAFGIEPEITVKLAKKKHIFYEVPISYNGRSYQEGKKITFLDGIRAIFCIFKYRFFD
jgi:hypothetical protein